MLKVGVAGLRRGWGLLHTFHNHRDAQVVAVCDQAAELRQKASDEFGIKASYADFAEMLAADLDAVVVATPAPLHAGQSIAALAAGAHVLSEVPAAWTLDECAALAAAVKRTGRTYMMAENMNYFHYLQVWKERIQAGEIGDVFYAEAEYIHDCRTLMRDAGGEFRVADVLEAFLVACGECIEKFASVLERCSCRILQVENRIASPTQLNPLVIGGQEAATPQA